MLTFTKPFTQQEPIPEAGIQQALEILRHGRLHRYNVAGDEISEVSLLEQEYAKWQGARYCVATASGGQAIQLGLRVCGVRPGDKVLANAYTLAPVPGAIHAVGAEPVLVEINADYKRMLKAEGLMTRDPRMVERKKPGQPKARKKFQFSKR